MQDIRFIQMLHAKEPYMALVFGRQIYRRCNEKLGQFEARVHHEAAKARESVWY